MGAPLRCAPRLWSIGLIAAGAIAIGVSVISQTRAWARPVLWGTRGWSSSRTKGFPRSGVPSPFGPL